MSPINQQITADDNQRMPSVIESQPFTGHQMDASRYDLAFAVKLPEAEDPNEWIANNLADFYKQIDLLYSTINCNRETCPKMTAGRKYEYLWSTDHDRRPIERCAFDYINNLLEWVQEQLDDEEVFPSMSVDKEFPANFKQICETISRRLLRVYAHVYHHHKDDVRTYEAHMNTSLKHFVYFVKEFNLVTAAELEPLKDFIDSLT